MESPPGNDENNRGKRRRTKTAVFDFQFMDNEEQRLLQQVRLYYIYIINSLSLSLSVY